jgi:hypothetical protein
MQRLYLIIIQMINWKTILGGLLIFAALQEFFRVVSMYNSGELKSWPFGVEVGLILFLVAGYYLIRGGIKRSKD